MNAFPEMNSFALIFLVMNGVALLTLPRCWASLPLLIGASYITLGQGITIGPFNFTVIRILLALGFTRVIVRNERLSGGMNSLDWLMVMWTSWALFCSLFYRDTLGVLVNRLGLVYNACGIYFLLRIFCQSVEDVFRLCRITAILLVPLSIEMLYEKMTGYNLFSELGGVSQFSEIRDSRIRAQGPFAHSILAGTAGAVCLPFMIGLWRQYRKTASTGIMACLSMVFSSGSSGPILSAICAIGALFAWRWRQQMQLLRWFAVLGYIGLEVIMKAPAYYLIARVDLTGSSTGWHRAALIESAIEHFSEWWLVGTDITRHWMPTGVPWSEKHTDITNYYLSMGVMGGLPLMLLFIAIFARGFSFVGKTLRQATSLPSASRFMIWAFGASLFTHAATCISISYFDQSVVFIYLTLAVIGSMRSTSVDSVVWTA